MALVLGNSEDKNVLANSGYYIGRSAVTDIHSVKVSPCYITCFLTIITQAQIVLMVFIYNTVYALWETGASCIQKHVVTESFYENIVNVWRRHRH